VRALQMVGPGQPFELREVPQPDPRPGQVLVKIGGAGACHSDLHLRDWPAEMLEMLGFSLPFTMGHENAGWVEAVGDGVSGLEPGQPVAVYGPWGCGRCWDCRQSKENYCSSPGEHGGMGGGLGIDGGMAEYLLVPSPRLLVPIGDLDPARAAPLGDAALTPYHGIKRSLPKLRAGSTAVVIGIGGLGHMAVELLRELSPARIIAVDIDETKLALAADLGAHETVVSDEHAAETIRAMTGGQGAELVLDVVGNDATLAFGAAAARVQGDLTILGIGGGTLPVSFFGIPYEVSVQTTYWGSITELMEVLDLARTGRLTARSTTYALEDAPHVYDLLAQGKVEGRAVITPNG
jgi:alcohol dehydrogenase, propanol-preferring